jgi:hypothetical protein
VQLLLCLGVELAAPQRFQDCEVAFSMPSLPHKSAGKSADKKALDT